MDTRVIPDIERRVVCIASQAGFGLAAIISSYFTDPSNYFAIFEFPTLNFPYAPSMEFESDGYFARVIGDKAAGEINNALARIQPDHVLIVGLTETEQTYLRVRLPEGQMTEIHDIEEFVSKFPWIQSPVAAVLCKTSQVVEGLLKAKFAKQRLAIDDSAPELSRQEMHGGTGIAVVESSGDVHDIASINYAFSFGLDVVIVEPFARETIRELPQVLAQWSKDNSHYSYKDFERKVTKALKGIQFSGYEFGTFFTMGMPYGLFLKNPIPCSHVMKNIDCGLFISNNLMMEIEPHQVDSSLHFSPQFFPSDETAEVIKILSESNFITKALVEDDATVRNLSDYAGYYPYDLLHICSHGGETEGYFAIQDFKDSHGDDHRIEFYEIVQIEYAGGEMAKVTRKMIYHRFDGHKWGSEALAKMPRHIFDDMFKEMRTNEEKVIRVPVKYPIAFSCHIRCQNGLHQGAFQTLSDVGLPIVFNNTCSSSHELSSIFVAAGARAYIGTLWDVGNKSASHAAKVFYAHLMKNGNLLAAFHEMVQQVVGKKYANIYVFWGLHFSSLTRPVEKSDDKVFAYLLHSFMLWVRKINTTVDPEIKRNAMPIAAFIYGQLVTNTTPERLQKIRSVDPKGFDEMMRSTPDPEDDDFTRGVSEITMP